MTKETPTVKSLGHSLINYGLPFTHINNFRNL